MVRREGGGLIIFFSHALLVKMKNSYKRKSLLKFFSVTKKKFIKSKIFKSKIQKLNRNCNFFPTSLAQKNDTVDLKMITECSSDGTEHECMWFHFDLRTVIRSQTSFRICDEKAMWQHFTAEYDCKWKLMAVLWLKRMIFDMFCEIIGNFKRKF